MDQKFKNTILEYKAPFLIEKLVKEHIVETDSEGEALFLELKRWLIIIHEDVSKNWQMYSLRVDEVWHQFILYSSEYSKFCLRFFGSFITHSPANAPETKKSNPVVNGSFSDFKISYERIFNTIISDLWYDEK